MAILLLAGGGTAVWHWAGHASPKPASNATRTGAAAGYNLLFITLDTVRADHLGCYGYARAATKNLDTLAATGVRFEQVIAPAPLTVPSHSTMMTGLDPPNHGARNNGSHLDPQRTTLAEVLAAHGYATAAFISSFILDKRFGLNQGFATYDDICAGDEKPGLASDPLLNSRSAATVTDAALEWLRRASGGGKPYFAWIHYFDAHFPCTPPAEYRRYASPYDGAIAYMDAQLGRVLDLLRRNESDKRTLIVVAADHGEGLEEHDEPTHGYLIYDSTVRVPLILNCPTLFGTPRVVADRVVSLADIMPTVLDLLGIPAPGALDGRHLLSAAPDPDRAIYIETMLPRLDNGWASLHGLRRLHDKYIRAPRPEYYDERSDPRELQNLAPLAPAELAQLEARLAEMMAHWDTPDQVAAQRAALSAEEKQRLASLGYVSAPDTGIQLGVLDPKDMMPLWRRVMTAELQWQQGRRAEAVAEIEAVLKQDPTNAHAWYWAASIYKQGGNTQQSEEAVRRALALNPSANGYVNLAQLLLMRSELGEEFERTLEKAQQLEPSNGGIYIARGDWYVMRGRPADAVAEYEKAGSLDPTNYGRLAQQKIEWVQRKR